MAVQPERRSERARRGARRRAQQQDRHLGRWLAAVVAVAALGAAYFGAIRPYDPSVASSAPSGADRPADPRITLVTGQSAPDFVLPDAGGGSVRLSELRAKSNVLLYFQEGLMCPPCWQQMRDLKRDNDKLTSLNVSLVTITVESLEDLRQYAPREQVEGMMLLADKDAEVSKRFQATYVSMHPGQRPGHTFILVGPSGKILWRRDFQEMYVADSTILDAVSKALGG